LSFSLTHRTVLQLGEGRVTPRNVLPSIVTGSAVALHCGKAHVQSQWQRANFDPPMTSKSLKFFKFELDIHDYIPEIYTNADFHFNLFSGGFSSYR